MVRYSKPSYPFLTVFRGGPKRGTKILHGAAIKHAHDVLAACCTLSGSIESGARLEDHLQDELQRAQECAQSSADLLVQKPIVDQRDRGVRDLPAFDFLVRLIEEPVAELDLLVSEIGWMKPVRDQWCEVAALLEMLQVLPVAIAAQPVQVPGEPAEVKLTEELRIASSQLETLILEHHESGYLRTRLDEGDKTATRLGKTCRFEQDGNLWQVFRTLHGAGSRGLTLVHLRDRVWGMNHEISESSVSMAVSRVRTLLKNAKLGITISDARSGSGKYRLEED